LSGFGLRVAPRIFGMRTVTLEVPGAFVHGREQDLLPLIEDIPWWQVFFDREGGVAFMVWFEQREDLNEIKKDLSRFAHGGTGIHYDEIREFYAQISDLGCKRSSITKRERNVLRALAEQPRAPLKQVAESSHHTQRTVREAIKRMAFDRIAQVVPQIQPAWARGIVLFQLLVYSEDAELLQQIRSLVPNHEVIVRLGDPAGIAVWAWTTSMAELLRIETRIRESGVDRVTYLMPVMVRTRLPPNFL